jgi:protein TonB
VNTAVLTEPGRRKLTELSQRSVVLAAIASVHALILYLLISGASTRYSGSESSVIQAEVIPIDRRIPNALSFPPVILQASSPIDPPPLQISIDVSADEPPAATQAIDTGELGDSKSLVAATASPEVDPTPVVRPQPIGGPRGADRYPSASIKAKESGKVVMNICVSPAGKVDSVELAQSSGFPRLDRVALSLASEYRFQPAMREGHPIAACVHYNIIFKLT